MENFTFYAPTYFAFGKDTENDTGKYVKRFGGSRVLLHYGGGSVIRSGLLDRVKKSLDREGVSYVELGGVKPNPRSGLVYEGIDLCRKENIQTTLFQALLPALFQQRSVLPSGWSCKLAVFGCLPQTPVRTQTADRRHRLERRRSGCERGAAHRLC